MSVNDNAAPKWEVVIFTVGLGLWTIEAMKDFSPIETTVFSGPGAEARARAYAAGAYPGSEI